MNKSILKHEIRSIDWLTRLSILVSFFIPIMFNISLENSYRMMFMNKAPINQAIVQSSLRGATLMILVVFTVISIIQIFLQFRSEKDQEVGRFLKSLPVKNKEFFKTKLTVGIINLTVAFIFLAIGFIIVRKENMFWIKDIYSISIGSEILIQADGVANILKEIGLVYLIVLSFYSFLFMVQYSFSNIAGGMVIGFFVWLSPAFILYSSMLTLEKFTSTAMARRFILNGIASFAEWLIPWAYPFQYNFNTWITDANGMGLVRIMYIENLQLKYIILIILILVNILIAYKFNKSSKVENENMIIPFKSSRNIFKIGVTICSGLLIPTILDGLIGIQMHNSMYVLFLVLGGAIGYFISKKIASVGTR